jgi:tripartite-type tricarboxylate transporter receptor subunit TctC
VAPTQAPATSAPVSASAAEFYKGKTVTIIVPFAPGGGFDQYPRMAQPSLEKLMPGTAVIVQNVEGAGGIVGTNQIYRAKPDGLTVGIGNIGGLVFAAATDQPGIQYDLTKFTWIGRVFSEPRSITVSAKSEIKSVEDMKKLGRQIKISATGVGSDDFYTAIALFKALGIPLKLVTGYGGQQECNLAILRGEVDGTVSALSGVRGAVDGGDLKSVLFISDTPVKSFETVPLAKSYVDKDGQLLLDAVMKVLEMERSFIAPPGIPEDRVAFLRQAFGKAYADQEVLDRLAKSKRGVDWLDGKIAEQKIVSVIAGGQALKDALKAEMAK